MNKDVKKAYMGRRRILSLKQKIQSKEYLENAIDKIAADLTVFLLK